MGVLYQNGDLIYGGARMKRVSQYEYDRLTPAEKNNGIIYNIYDADGVQGYNPKGVALTQAEYDALVEGGETESNVMYFITDGTTTTLQSVWDKVGTTPLDSSLPSDCSQAINQLKSNLTELEKHSLGTAISLTAGTEYTTLSDGYFRVALGSSAGGSSYIYGQIDGQNVITINGVSGGAIYGYPSNSVFVRKGTVIKYTGSSNSSATFLPLT